MSDSIMHYCEECKHCTPHEKMEYATCRVRPLAQNKDNIQLVRVSRDYAREVSVQYNYCEIIRTTDKCGGFSPLKENKKNE